MFYIIYKTTNLVNGKFYIGKHKTKNLDDGYLGSGKLLRHAIKKYGLDNFHRKILFICKTEKEMNLLEKILVVPDREINYNLCPGGHGGFGYINTELTIDKSIAGKRGMSKTNIQMIEKHGPNWRSIIRSKPRGYGGNPGFFTGRTHTEEWKQNHSARMKEYTGEKSSQFGTMWITNGIENKKIKKDVDIIPDGWYKGRKFRRAQ